MHAEVCGGFTGNNAEAFLYASDSLDAFAAQKGKAEGVTVFTWVEFEDAQSVHKDHQVSSCADEYTCTFSQLRIVPPQEPPKEDVVGRVLLSYDLETDTDGVLSDATINPIFVIGVVLTTPSGTRGVSFTWGGNVDPIPNGEVVVCENEGDALEKFAVFVREADPDVVMGFNNFHFDDPYLEERARRVFTGEEVKEFLSCFTRLYDVPFSSFKVDRSTKGGGDKEVIVHLSPGVWRMDIQRLASDRLHMPWTGLNEVALSVLETDAPENQKHDVKACDIRPMFLGDAKQRATLIGYCIQDADLVARIERAKDWTRSLCEEARFFGMLPRQVTTLGKQAMLTRLASGFAYALNMAITKHRAFKRVSQEVKQRLLAKDGITLQPAPFALDSSLPELDDHSLDEDDYSPENDQPDETSWQFPQDEDEPFVPFYAKVPFHVLAQDVQSETTASTHCVEEAPDSNLKTGGTLDAFLGTSPSPVRRKPVKPVAKKAAKAPRQTNTLERFLDKGTKDGPAPSSSKKKKKARYPGAFVFPTVHGRHRLPVFTFDFSSLYPSLMRAHNLSIDTLVGTWEDVVRMGLTRDQVLETLVGYYFVKEEVWKGLYARMAEFAMTQRKATKKRMAQAEKEGNKILARALDAKQTAQKLGANSLYGAAGGATCNLTCVYMAYAITSYGKHYVTRVKEFVESQQIADDTPIRQLRVVAGDTDSVFVTVEFVGDNTFDREKLTRVGHALGKALNSSGLYPPPMSVEFEKVMRDFMSSAKKHYAAMVYAPDLSKPPYVMIKGLPSVRREAIEILRRTFNEVLDMALLRNMAEQDISAYVRSQVMLFYQEKVPVKDVTITQKLSKQVYDNGDRLPHVCAWKHWMRVSPSDCPRVGERVRYVLVKMADPDNPKKQTDKTYLRARPPFFLEKFPRTMELDYEFTMKNKFKKPMMDLLQMLYSNEEDVAALFSPPAFTDPEVKEAKQASLKRKREDTKDFIAKYFKASKSAEAGASVQVLNPVNEEDVEKVLLQ